MSKVVSTTFQTLAENGMANKLAKRYGLRFGAKKFVAGSNLEQAVEGVQRLNGSGMSTMLNYLGEHADSQAGTIATSNDLINTIETIHREQLDCYLSIKLRSLGLEIDKDLCAKNLDNILKAAEEKGVFVRIEMENYANCQKTLDIFREMQSKYENIGTVIQAYLYRSKQDLEDLGEYKANVRLVKGAYNESAKVAFPQKKDVDENYKQLITAHMLNGHYAGIATHDSEAIEHTIQVAEQYNIAKDKFEFQMLHGIRTDLQHELKDKGYKVRVYLPYGVDWFGYFMRRLAERPENVSFVLNNMFKKRTG